MTLQGIREAVASIGIPSIKRTERYEDSRAFVGTVFGETVASESNVAHAFRRACGLGEDPADDELVAFTQEFTPPDEALSQASCCGVACDSDCACL